MKRATLDQLVKTCRAKQAVATLTNLDEGSVQLIADPAEVADAVLREAVTNALKNDKSQTADTPAGPVFINVFSPPLRLILVGAVHIAGPLSRMGLEAGYAVTLIDPREAFGNAERFPGLTLSNAWPDEALAALAPDDRTAVVTLTHDPKLDDAALNIALKSPCFYIGSLGSKKTHAARLERLRRQGWGEADLARIHGPVGLAIGAKSPAEIAVSILAQIIETRRNAADAGS